MEKLGEESAAKFINALIKSVQTLCHGYLDFQNGVEIIGHINLNVDKGSSLDYILKEKVCKNAENSTLFISNSFHAEPKPDQDVSGKTSQSGNQVAQNNESSDAAETGRVSSAISSISTALTESRERLRRNSGARDSNSFHSLPNTAKRKASEEENSECHPAKISYHDRLSHVTSESSYPAETSSPIDSKEALLALRTAESDLSETVLPQTASVRSDGSDIGVNLAGSVLEPVEGQLNADLPEREEDSDGDLEVTFIKEEYVEGEGSACDFDGQQFASGQHQRGSDGMPDPSLFSMGPQSSSAPATYVPSAAGQQFPVSGSSSSASQPQPGPSGMRGPSTPLQLRAGAAGSQSADAVPLESSLSDALTRKAALALPKVVARGGNLTTEQKYSSGAGYIVNPSDFVAGASSSLHARSSDKDPGLVGAEEKYSVRARNYAINPSDFVVGGTTSSSSSSSLSSSSHPRPCSEKEPGQGFPPILLCEFCNASFTSSGGLSLHKATVHFKRKFVCNACGKTFTRKENLARHIASNHVKPPETVL